MTLKPARSMKNRYFGRFGACCASAVLLIIPVRGQASVPPAESKAGQNPAETRIIGDVLSVDPAGKTFVLRSASGDIKVQASDKTRYLRVPPGEKTLEKAETIKFEDVGVGDRVLARGKASSDPKTVPVLQVIVMSKAAIAQKHERDREEWRRRGINGTVTAINPAKQEITVTTRSFEGQKQVVVAAGDSVQFRRYAPDSVRFSDAQPSTFQDLKTGDQIRALGEKNAEGSRLQAEMIVFGSFVMAGGEITGINPAAGLLTINNIPTKKPLTIVVNKDTVLRRFPPQLAAMMAMRINGAATDGAPGAGASGDLVRRGQRGGQSAGEMPGGSRSADRPQGRGEPSGRGPGSGGGAPGGVEGERPRMMGGDIQTVLERLPAVSLTELKPGEMILVSSTVGADPSRVTAIIVAAGVEALLTLPAQSTVAGASLGLPSGVLDFGMGIP